FDCQGRPRSRSNDAAAVAAEQRHAAVFLIVCLFPDRLERSFGELGAEPADWIFEKLVFEPGEYRVSDCLRGLKNHIPDEAVANNHFRGVLEQVVSFDVTAKIESARFQEFESF